MATHSSILAWKIPWTEEPGGLQSIGWQIRHDWNDLAHTYTPGRGWRRKQWGAKLICLSFFLEHICLVVFSWGPFPLQQEISTFSCHGVVGCLSNVVLAAGCYASVRDSSHWVTGWMAMHFCWRSRDGRSAFVITRRALNVKLRPRQCAWESGVPVTWPLLLLCVTSSVHD